MKQTPLGWPRLSISIYYDNASKAIDWLCLAFGFDVRLKVEGDGGRVEHSELVYGEAVIMVAQSGANPRRPRFPRGASPVSLDGRITQGVMVYVDSVDDHHQRAVAAGATIIDEPQVHDYGPDYWADRSYGALDLEGHMWWFTERLRNPPNEQGSARS
jgi:uncharacterized glyoxalase superfamily protein PhnB